VPVTVAVMIALAALIHRYVEVPTNRLGRRLGARRPAAPTPAPEVVVVPG
jgi:peptidoglycan/LPS O-acetylase OafA/YrhL